MPITRDLARGEFTISGPDFEPAFDPAWRTANATRRRDYWREVARLAVEAVRRMLRKRLDVMGRPMPPRRRPRGDGARGPVLSPHHGNSRFQRLLRHVGHSNRAVVWWGRGWHVAVEGHATGAATGIMRDVCGLSPEEQARVASEARGWWARRYGGGGRGAPLWDLPPLPPLVPFVAPPAPAPAPKPPRPRPAAKPAPPPAPPRWEPRPDARFRTFPATAAGLEAMDRWGDRASRTWAESLTPAERAEAREYGKSSYYWLNGLARGQTWAQIQADPRSRAGFLPEGLTEERARERLKTVRDLFDRGRLPEPVVLWRGVKDTRALGFDPAGLKAGDEFVEPAFASTSLDPALATTFAALRRFFPTNAVLRIHAPEGTRGAFLDAKPHELATYKEAREVVLAPGSRYRFVRREEGRDEAGGTLDVLVFEVVP